MNTLMSVEIIKRLSTGSTSTVGILSSFVTISPIIRSRTMAFSTAVSFQAIDLGSSSLCLYFSSVVFFYVHMFEILFSRWCKREGGGEEKIKKRAPIFKWIGCIAPRISLAITPQAKNERFFYGRKFGSKKMDKRQRLAQSRLSADRGED